MQYSEDETIRRLKRAPLAEVVRRVEEAWWASDMPWDERYVIILEESGWTEDEYKAAFRAEYGR